MSDTYVVPSETKTVADEFALDIQIDTREEFLTVGPQMDGWTTYTTCHGTCTCPPQSSPTDSCGGRC